MTRKMFRPVLALALALGMLAAISNPSHAALSTADRTDAAAAPAPQTTTVASVAPAAVVTPAPVVAAAPVVTQPRKVVAHKAAAPRRFTANAFAASYPCH